MHTKRKEIFSQRITEKQTQKRIETQNYVNLQEEREGGTGEVDRIFVCLFVSKKKRKGYQPDKNRDSKFLII